VKKLFTNFVLWISIRDLRMFEIAEQNEAKRYARWPRPVDAVISVFSVLQDEFGSSTRREATLATWPVICPATSKIVAQSGRAEPRLMVGVRY
jgi:hypothetical protein